MHELGREMLPLTTLAMSTMSVLFSTLVYCVASSWCLGRWLSVCKLLELLKAHFASSSLKWLMFMWENFYDVHEKYQIFRHLVAPLEYPKCLFLAHCRVLSHLLHTLGQYLVFLNCENWLVLHSTLLHVWLQVTFASSKPGLLDMRNRKKEKNRPRLLSLDLFVFSVSQQRNRSSLLSLDLFGCSVSQKRNRSRLLTCWNSSQLRNPSWSTSNIRNAVSTWVQVWVQGWV